MPSEDTILLKLIIQGQDPSSIEALARSTQGQLNERIRGYLDQLKQMHRDANAAIDKNDAEAYQKAQARIDIATKQLEVVQKVARANEIAANRSQNAWKGTLEVMENISTSAQFMYGVISSGLSSLHDLAESVDRVTNVYGALRGSISEMREASKGEISDYDLITTKNRAMEKELELTDSQFGAVAAAADNFADALGVNTKEALDKIVDGLATGRVKMLEHAGVVINVDDAYKKYAKSIGVAVDQLNDHGKKIAVVRESLRAMDQKLAESGKGVDDFSHRYEKMVASLKNSTDQVLLSLGELGVKIFELFETAIPRGIRHTIAAVNDVADLLNPLTGFTKGHRLQDEKAFDAIEDKNKAAAADKTAREAAARLAAGTSYNYQQGTVSDSIDQKRLVEAAKKAEEERAKFEKFNNQFAKMLRGDKTEGTPGLDVVQLGEDQRSHDLDMAFDPTGSRRAAPGGLSGGLARQAALQRAFGEKAQRDEVDVDRQQAQAAEAMAKVNEDALTEMLDKADKLRERAGNGVFATILFGPSGHEELLDDIDSFKNAAADAMGIVSDTAMKMAEALGASLAAFVSGDKNKRKSVRDTTHDILEALATQAYARAIFETAEGLASLALGPIGGASATAHFAAAGMFTAVGTAAGLGARAIGQSSQASGAGAGTGKGAGSGSSASTGGSGVTSSGSGFGSGGVRSSGSGSGSQNITIVVNSQFTTQAEVGRAINLALAESYARDGRGVPVSMGSV